MFIVYWSQQSHINTELRVERCGASGDLSSAPEGVMAAEEAQWYFLQRSCSGRADGEKETG